MEFAIKVLLVMGNARAILVSMVFHVGASVRVTLSRAKMEHRVTEPARVLLLIC